MFLFISLFWVDKKNLNIFNFRRKTAVQYTESSDSEEVETGKLQQKMKGNIKWI